MLTPNLDIPEAIERRPLDPEMKQLVERVRALPPDMRSGLEPVVADVVEESRFRNRILTVARDAIERLRLDLEATRFDLDATRRDRKRLEGLLSDLIQAS